MKVFSGLPNSLTVRHYDVTEPSCVWSLQGPGLTVFWQGERPVGHILQSFEGAPYNAGIRGFAPLDERPERAPTLGATIVICTRDRPDDLERCLRSLKYQTYQPEEVIVVDNASSDLRTRDVALAAGVTYVREDRPGLDVARNTGALAANSDIVAYADDDEILHVRWLERLVAAFDEPGLMAVTGLVLPAELDADAQTHFETYWSFGHGYERRDFRAAEFAASPKRVFPAWTIGAGASMAFRREIFEHVGLFDERLDAGRAGCSGDSEYWYRILAAGYDCRYEPSAVSFHFHRRTNEALARQIFNYMRGHSAALLVQHERTGIRANLSRAFWFLPRWYLLRIGYVLLGGRESRDAFFLKQEIMGYFSGILFYVREPRPDPTHDRSSPRFYRHSRTQRREHVADGV